MEWLEIGTLSALLVQRAHYAFRSRESAYFTYFAVSWLLVWGTYWAMRAVRPGARELSWVQLLGATLMMWPFVRYGNVVWEQWSFVVDRTSVAGTVPAHVWWESLSRRWWMSVLLPGLGLFLFRRPSGSAWMARVHVDRVLVGTGLIGRGRGWLRILVDACVVFLAVLIGYMLYEVATAPFRSALETGDESRVFNALDPWLGLVLAFTAGVTEEFLFRGVLQRRLALAMPIWAAIGLQAIGFGLIHSGYGTIDHMVGPALFGVVAGVVAHRWGLVPAILVHFLIDLFAFWNIAAELGYPWTQTWLGVLFVLIVTLPLTYWALHAYRRFDGRLPGVRRPGERAVQADATVDEDPVEALGPGPTHARGTVPAPSDEEGMPEQG